MIVDLTHAFSSFQMICSKRYHMHVGPLQRISYTLEIGMSIMELQWFEFLVICIFQIACITPSWKMLCHF